MVQGKKRKPEHGFADIAPRADHYDDNGKPEYMWNPDEKEPETDSGPCHEGGGEGSDPGTGDGGGPGAVGKDAPGSGQTQEDLWYVVCIESRGKRHIKEVRVRPGNKITFGPMAMGGRFPACWRVYEGKDLVFALTGVVWFHRRDFKVREYAE